MSKDEMHIEYSPLSEILKWPRNPRKHAIKEMGESLERFGFNDPPTIDENTMHLVEGHGRIETLDKRKAAGEKPPDRIRVREDGEWMVPVVRGVAFTDEFEAEAYLIAHNRLTEIGGYDQSILADVLTSARQNNLDGIGFSSKDVDKILAAARPLVVVEDEVPERATTAITKPGDLWILGNHRLLCGDSTNAENVARVLNGRLPFMMVTDPPYGVEYDPAWRNEVEGPLGQSRSTGKVQNDDRADWSAAYALFTGAIAYVWHAGVYAAKVSDGLAANGFDIRAQIIWVKQHFVFGRGAYHWQHEPCWFAVRKGKTADWTGDRKQTTVWEIANKGAFGGNKEDADTNHGTQKPVECMARPIKNHGGPGVVVYEPFSGSGTTIVAAEQLDRHCYAIEIDPIYIDMAVERWQNLTGKKAQRG